MKSSGALRFVPAAGATALLGLVLATRPLTGLPRGIAIACAVAAWAAAVIPRRGDVRAHATVVLSIAVATACGQVDAGLPYGIGCGLLFFGCLLSMRVARGAVLRVPRLERAHVVLALAGPAIIASLLVGIPALEKYVERRFDAMFGGGGIEATAFSTTMVLGSTRGMLQSSTVVMHIDGERPDYVRGAVYDRYEPPYWLTTDRGRARTTVPARRSESAAPSRITLVRGAPSGDDMRWFLPARACDLGVEPGTIEIDAFGIARRARGEQPQEIDFRTTGCRERSVVPVPPNAEDLGVPPHVKSALGPIAARWSSTATSPRGKLDAIQRELQRFEYSLDVERSNGVDAVVDFVTIHRAGHCELFASAMVLMARSEGIPARVVGGYHVSEVNPLTGRAVVRDRNAHAWVEAWVDGAWREWDPTPATDALRQRPSMLDYAGDLVSSLLERAVTTIAKLGILAVAAILAVVVVALLCVRWLGTRLRTRHGRRYAASESALPLPCFDALTQALARAGLPRDEWEPLEDFARRVAASSSPWASDVARAVLDYAGLRYGGVGEPGDVVEVVERATRSVRAVNRGAPRTYRSAPGKSRRLGRG